MSKVIKIQLEFNNLEECNTKIMFRHPLLSTLGFQTYQVLQAGKVPRTFLHHNSNRSYPFLILIHLQKKFVEFNKLLHVYVIVYSKIQTLVSIYSKKVPIKVYVSRPQEQK